MTNLTNLMADNLPLRGGVSAEAKSPLKDGQETPETDFEQLLSESTEEAVAEQIAALSGLPSIEPAKATGNSLPVAGTSLPVEGDSLPVAEEILPVTAASLPARKITSEPNAHAQLTASEASAEDAPPARGSITSPAHGQIKQDGDVKRAPADPVPSAAALKVATKIISPAAIDGENITLPRGEVSQEQPKPSTDAAKLPAPQNAAAHTFQLLRPGMRDRLTVVAVPGQGPDTQLAEVSAETGIRPILSAPATDNAGASLQHFGQSSAAPSAPSTLPAQSQTLPAAHDFEGMVDRLVEAREAANTGRAQMAVRHDEFGQVSVRLEHAAAGMKFALSSMDADFSPAVQSALAARTAPERMDVSEFLSGNSGNDRHSADARAFGHGEHSNPQQNGDGPPTDELPILSTDGAPSTGSARRHQTGLYV